MSTDTDTTSIQHLFSESDAGQEVPTQTEQAPPQEFAGEQGQQPPPPDVEGQGLHGEDGQPTEPPAERQQQEEEQPRMVPLPELIETRKRAQEAERAAQDLQQRYQQLEQMVQGLYQQQAPQEQHQQQQRPQEPDPFDDPHAYARSIEERVMGQVQQQFLNQQLNASEERARSAYGAETVDEAFEAARQAGIAQAFVNQADPYGELVKWHKAQRLQSEIGDDPESYKKQLRDQVRQELLAEMKQGTPPPSNLPPSLSTATKANTAPEVVKESKDWFKEMMNKR